MFLKKLPSNTLVTLAFHLPHTHLIVAFNIQNTITFLSKLNSFYGTNESSSVLISKSVTLEICLPTDLTLNTKARRFCFIFHLCLYKNGLILSVPLRLSHCTPVKVRKDPIGLLSLNARANNANTDEDSYHLLVYIYTYNIHEKRLERTRVKLHFSRVQVKKINKMVFYKIQLCYFYWYTFSKKTFQKV